MQVEDEGEKMPASLANSGKIKRSNKRNDVGFRRPSTCAKVRDGLRHFQEISATTSPFDTRLTKSRPI